MARLLENQAKELLREASSMAGGDVEGFAAVAFPLVRRVFGSLIANDLVSVQPMSLPSGLIFFLDFTTSPDGPGLPRLGYPANADQTAASGTSLYGGGRIGAQITGGVLLTGLDAERGPYALNNGYSSPTGSSVCDCPRFCHRVLWVLVVFIVLDADLKLAPRRDWCCKSTSFAWKDSALQFDPDLVSGASVCYCVASHEASWLRPSGTKRIWLRLPLQTVPPPDLADGNVIRRLTSIESVDDATLVGCH